jgi:hypothetical protein
VKCEDYDPDNPAVMRVQCSLKTGECTGKLTHNFGDHYTLSFKDIMNFPEALNSEKNAVVISILFEWTMLRDRERKPDFLYSDRALFTTLSLDAEVVETTEDKEGCHRDWVAL